ncbi:cysteine proteinase [Ramicandelaber brevisporus]|nr:cysteine proteinase [Ramicandelaber brevisporus]KAI8873680.1 cysteine proteinase [Ramicandelaber brevisporus]
MLAFNDISTTKSTATAAAASTVNGDSKQQQQQQQQQQRLAPAPAWYTLTDAQLDAYFARIGLADTFSAAKKPPATLETLSTIINGHTTSIPFDSITRQLLVPQQTDIKLDAESICRKMIDGKRGGVCFEHNTLLRAVMATLGYRLHVVGSRVTDMSQRLFINVDESSFNGDEDAMMAKIDELLDGIDVYSRGYDHIGMLTLLDGKVYYVDVGFARSTPTVPVLLDSSGRSKITLGTYNEQCLIRPLRRADATSFLAETQLAFLVRCPQPNNLAPSPSSFANGLAVHAHNNNEVPSAWELRAIFGTTELYPNDVAISAFFVGHNKDAFFNTTPHGYITTKTGSVANLCMRFTIRDYDADGKEIKTIVRAETAEELAAYYEKYFGITLNEQEKEYAEKNIAWFRGEHLVRP